MKSHLISQAPVGLEHIAEFISADYLLELSEGAKARILHCRNYLDKKLQQSSKPVYGINTGFGALQDVEISSENLEELQKNLVLSHACGTGDEVPVEIVKLMLFLKIQSLSYGNSGIRLETIERLIDMYNRNIIPVVYTQGSLGASGDLAPLAHLSLPLLGMGEVWHEGEKRKAAQVLKKMDWEPLHLAAKEGLALLNGTQFMSAYGVWALLKAKHLSHLADMNAALSVEAFDCLSEPFLPYIHNIRPHKGQRETAKNILDLLEGSEISKQSKQQVQDPYSFRCVPQVHGATKDAIAYVERVFLTEINSVTDNPNIFPEEDLILSGGNFHGQPLALAFDFLAIALAELGNISERRTFQLMLGRRGLPPFLVAKPGLNSGLMIAQYTAASIVSENKQLCTPASVDSIVSSNGQEDHVSMGANAAVKTHRVIRNLENVLAIEWLSACQALEFRRPLKSSPKLESWIADYRKEVPFIERDCVISELIRQTRQFLEKI